jgi:hypothetical protein
MISKRELDRDKIWRVALVMASAVRNIMFYEVKLSPEECFLLASLIGQPIELVATDGWAVELRVGTTLLSVIPKEVATPDAAHQDGVFERPLIQAVTEPLQPEHSRVIGERLGVLRAVNVISTLIGFSPVVDCPAEEIIPGVMLPESRGYGWVYYPPLQCEQAALETGAGALVDLDIAFELIAEECRSVVVYTSGFFVNVSIRGLPLDQEWVSLGAYVRRGVS